MNILVLGGTRFFGREMVRTLIQRGHHVTIATRGRAGDDFGGQVARILTERTDENCLRRTVGGARWDIVCDSLAYSSNDVRRLLDVVDCGRYVMTSSTAVYEKHMDTREEEFNPAREKLLWCDRQDLPYGAAKRQAEAALAQTYAEISSAAARFPFVIGQNDYTRRLAFYVEHTVRGIPMFVDNPDAPMEFIRQGEAGAFLAFLAESGFRGGINGSCSGTISIRELTDYAAKRCGRPAIFTPDGEPAPYNGEHAYSICTDRAEALGFRFSNLREWIFDLLDFYLDAAQAN